MSSSEPSPSTNLSTLTGKTAGFLVASGFAESEFAGLQRAFARLGIKSLTIAPDSGLVNGWTETTKEVDGKTVTMGDWGHYHPVDRQLGETLAADLDIVIVPGGSRSLTKLGQNLHLKRIVNHALDAEKPVLLFGAAAELLQGRSTPASVMTPEVTADESWIEPALTHLAHSTEQLQQAESRAAA